MGVGGGLVMTVLSTGGEADKVSLLRDIVQEVV